MQAYYSKAFAFFGQAFLNLCLLFIVAFILVNLLEWIKTRRNFKWRTFSLTSILLITTIACLGFSIGLLIGLSQSPVANVAITGLLSFYGGFVTFLFAKDSFKNEHDKIAVLVSAILVSVFLIYGVEIGSREKSVAEKSQKEIELIYLDKQEMIKKKYK